MCCIFAISAVWRAAPSRPIMAAFGFSISGRLIATGRYFQKKVRAPRKQRLPAVLSDAEIRALLGCVRNPIHRTCFALMYACGLRIGEAATVEIASVDRASLLLRIIGKGDKERRVPTAAANAR